MPDAKESSISLLKETHSIDELTRSVVPSFGLYSQMIGLLTSKGVDLEHISEAVRHRTNRLYIGHAINALLLRVGTDGTEDGFVQDLMETGLQTGLTGVRTNSLYTGTPEENLAIDQSITQNKGRSAVRNRTGVGSQRVLDLDGVSIPERLADTPITVIGAGASGEMMCVSLHKVGYRNISVIDQRGDFGGIWEDERVHGGSKNNPFPLTYTDIAEVGAAPGEGEDIRRFLGKFARFLRTVGIDVSKGRVTKVTPGDLEHTITVKKESGTESITSPIVIMAPGHGTPLSPNRPGVIESSLSKTDTGKRWQEILTLEQAEELTKLTSPESPLLLVGFGNSTAEMLIQIIELNETNPHININFKVITHYPAESVYEPDETYVNLEGKEFKLYRDIYLPNLTKLAGDLPDIDGAVRFVRASKNLIPGLKRWYKENEYIVFETDTETYKYIYNRKLLYTLIGYGHTPEFLNDIGLKNAVRDSYSGQIHYDWDGELQKQPGETGRDRLYPGYFGLGPILKTPENPNAAVIPGDFFRMNDMLFTVILRSEEYYRRQRS